MKTFFFFFFFLLRFFVKTKLRNKIYRKSSNKSQPLITMQIWIIMNLSCTCIVNLGNCRILRNNFPMCPWIILQLSYKGTFVYIIYPIVFPPEVERGVPQGEYISWKSDNNEICSLNPFFGVIVLYPKSIPWALEFTNNFYKISS